MMQLYNPESEKHFDFVSQGPHLSQSSPGSGAVMPILLYCYLEYKWIWIIQSSLLKKVDDRGIILDLGQVEKAFF